LCLPHSKEWRAREAERLGPSEIEEEETRPMGYDTRSMGFNDRENPGSIDGRRTQNPRHSLEMKTEALRLCEETNLSAKDIGDKLNIPGRTIARWCTKLRKEKKREKVEGLHQSGVSITKIAELIGSDNRTIKKILGLEHSLKDLSSSLVDNIVNTYLETRNKRKTAELLGVSLDSVDKYIASIVLPEDARAASARQLYINFIPKYIIRDELGVSWDILQKWLEGLEPKDPRVAFGRELYQGCHPSIISDSPRTRGEISLRKLRDEISEKVSPISRATLGRLVKNGVFGPDPDCRQKRALIEQTYAVGEGAGVTRSHIRGHGKRLDRFDPTGVKGSSARSPRRTVRGGHSFDVGPRRPNPKKKHEPRLVHDGRRPPKCQLCKNWIDTQVCKFKGCIYNRGLAEVWWEPTSKHYVVWWTSDANWNKLPKKYRNKMLCKACFKRLKSKKNPFAQNKERRTLRRRNLHRNPRRSKKEKIYLPTRLAAQQLGCQIETLRSWARRGAPHRRTSRGYLEFNVSEVRNWLTHQRAIRGTTQSLVGHSVSVPRIPLATARPILRQIKKELGLTLSEMAEKLQIKRNTLVQYIGSNKKTGSIPREIIIRAEALREVINGSELP